MNGIRHWTARHPRIGIDVSSYWLPDLKVLLDPLAVPDDGVLHIPRLNALAIADTVVHYGDDLQFVPDQYMDDPAAEKRGIREGLGRLAGELEFEHLLVAHGTPIPDEGRERLRAFAEARGV